MGPRLAIAGLLFGLAACNTATDPLDELAVGEGGRVARTLDGDALVPDTGQSVRLVGAAAPAAPWRDRQGVAGAMKGPEERFAVCDDAWQGSALILETGKSAAELCRAPQATRFQARGFRAADGPRSAIRPISKSSIETYASGISPAFIGSPTIRSRALRNLPSA